jgi:hypothetical protein
MGFSFDVYVGVLTSRNYDGYGSEWIARMDVRCK